MDKCGVKKPGGLRTFGRGARPGKALGTVSRLHRLQTSIRLTLSPWRSAHWRRPKVLWRSRGFPERELSKRVSDGTSIPTCVRVAVCVFRVPRGVHPPFRHPTDRGAEATESGGKDR